jgi:Xaa-Pro aminopeptidase
VQSEEKANKYFPHGLGHHWLDVHDPGLYNTLEANMVITIEPGFISQLVVIVTKNGE